MKYIAASIIAVFLAGCSMSTEKLVADVKDGVVLITDEVSATQGSLGTGFIVGENKIVTNLHVVSEKGTIEVYANGSQKKYKVKVIHKDEVADIAVLQLDDWELFEKNETPVTLLLGDSDEAEVGDKIVVIGHPWGLDWSVSEGIISAKERRLGANPKFLDQVDAKVFQGNSGGPIFDESGKVVCVSNMIFSEEGGSYGFCIPSELVKKVLYDFETFGEIRWRAINVSVGLTEDGSSVILNDVEANGAADKAGLKKGDKILSIQTPNNISGGLKVRTPNDLITAFAKLKGDEENVRLTIDRNGELIMINVKTNYRLSTDYTPDQAE